METRFILPVTVATALHAFVLFGISSTHSVTPIDPPIKTTALKPFPKDVIEVELPPPSEDATPQPKGTPRPVEDDPVVRWEPTTEPTQVPIPTPTSGPHVVKIEPGPIGMPDGTGPEWTKVPVVNSKFLDSKPRTRAQVQPIYPDEAKRQGLTGEVWVEFIVDEVGRVVNPRVVKSNNSLFDGPTLRAVERWRFEPGKKDHQTVRFRMAVPVVFNLER